MKINNLNVNSLFDENQLKNEDYKKIIIKKIYENKRTKKMIDDEKITYDEVLENISTFIQMFKRRFEYFIYLKRQEDGKLKKVISLSNEFKQASFKNNFWLTEITEINFDNKIEIVIDKLKNSAIKNLLKSSDILKSSFYLCGETGKGKTLILEAIAIERARKNNETIAFINMSDLFSFAFKNMIGKNSLFFPIIEKFKQVDVLFLDDLGSETHNNWFLNSLLTPILKYRHKFNKNTYFSSNYSQDDLFKLYSSDTKKISPEVVKRFVSIVKDISKIELFTE
ncbi:DnaA ATPase domain-containing protein [[Mycoplasma] collis]|uniref:DnaA ATPase domain-containing protein n=1 Tax=[Mycoplasma] collis TaxID=2127 RepID=UPI00051C0652|nr:AAA family ATPase [[Mycoplasma] collis]